MDSSISLYQVREFLFWKLLLKVKFACNIHLCEFSPTYILLHGAFSLITWCFIRVQTIAHPRACYHALALILNIEIKSHISVFEAFNFLPTSNNLIITKGKWGFESLKVKCFWAFHDNKITNCLACMIVV